MYTYCEFVAYFFRPFNDSEDDSHGGHIFGFNGFPFNHDDMFRQFDEAFNRMMKNFGAFDGHSPDQEQGTDLHDSDLQVIRIVTHIRRV